ncbi:MAG: hypothetical protein F6K26_40560 [Moorea sp. SIO2I5]|nr:hypothetical protein [Moorena sp. SIO2I5]
MSQPSLIDLGQKATLREWSRFPKEPEADREQVYVAEQMNYDHHSKLKPMRGLL